MKPEISLLCLWEFSIGPYPESDQFSPYPHTLLFKRLILVLSSHLRLVLAGGLKCIFSYPHVCVISNPPVPFRFDYLDNSW